jgi:hypothetical protein
LNNIKNNVDEQKYFKLKKSNKLVEQHLLGCPLATNILQAVNFIDEGDFIFLPFPPSQEESIRTYVFIS